MLPRTTLTPLNWGVLLTYLLALVPDIEPERCVHIDQGVHQLGVSSSGSVWGFLSSSGDVIRQGNTQILLNGTIPARAGTNACVGELGRIFGGIFPKSSLGTLVDCEGIRFISIPDWESQNYTIDFDLLIHTPSVVLSHNGGYPLLSITSDGSVVLVQESKPVIVLPRGITLGVPSHIQLAVSGRTVVIKTNGTKDKVTGSVNKLKLNTVGASIHLDSFSKFNRGYRYVPHCSELPYNCMDGCMGNLSLKDMTREARNRLYPLDNAYATTRVMKEVLNGFDGEVVETEPSKPYLSPFVPNDTGIIRVPNIMFLSDGYISWISIEEQEC